MACGVGLAIYAAVIAGNLKPISRETVGVPPCPTCGADQPDPAKAKAIVTQLRAGAPVPKVALADQQDTNRSETPSETYLGALFGTAAILALAGAFFTRVTKISLPGGAALEFSVVAKDLTEVAKSVPQQVQQAIERLPDSEKEALAPKVGDLAAAAADRAQQGVLEARSAVAGLPVESPVSLTVEDISRVQRGKPLSDELLQSLVKDAVESVVGEELGEATEHNS
jgi:hypothetical protein